MIYYNDRNVFFCTLDGLWGDNFIKKFQILEKKRSFIFFMLLLFHKP